MRRLRRHRGGRRQRRTSSDGRSVIGGVRDAVQNRIEAVKDLGVAETQDRQAERFEGTFAGEIALCAVIVNTAIHFDHQTLSCAVEVDDVAMM